MKQLQKKDLIQIYTNNGFSFNEANSEIDFAIEIMFGISPKDLVMGIMPDAKDLEKLYIVVKKRVETKAPIAQIIGAAYFMRHKFEVSAATLIPRPETELLVNKAVEIIKNNEVKHVLDIGTGSGCIACMIAKLTNAQVLGVDISNEALKISLNNAMHLDLMNKALFRKSDLFSKIREEEKFDVIVSNPPYIPIKDKTSLQIEVREFEPETALFAQDENGIEFYQKIIESARNFLTPKGYVLFELGINQAELVKKMFLENGFENIEIFKDVTGIERVISARAKD